MGILELMRERRIYFDGGMGSLLQARGLKPGELPETWNLSRPEIITEIHREYLDAGRGGPPVKRLCWTAVWGATLHRKAFPHGRAAPTPTLPALPKRAAPARAQQRAVHG